MTNVRLQAEAEQLKLENAAIRSKVSVLEDQIRVLEVSKIEATIESAQKTSESLQSLKKAMGEAETSRRTAEQKTAENERLRAENAMLTSRMSKLEQAARDNRGSNIEKEQAVAENKRLEAERAMLVQRVAHLEMNADKMIANVKNDAGNAFKQMELKTEQMGMEMAQVKSKLAKIQKECEVMALDDERKETENRRLKTENTRLNETVNSLTMEVQTLKSKKQITVLAFKTNLRNIEKNAAHVKSLAKTMQSEQGPGGDEPRQKRVTFGGDTVWKTDDDGERRRKPAVVTGTARNYTFAHTRNGGISLVMAFRETIVLTNNEGKAISLDGFTLVRFVDGESHTRIALPVGLVIPPYETLEFFDDKPSASLEKNQVNLNTDKFRSGKVVKTILENASGEQEAEFVLRLNAT